jgi:hypothetical protein
MRHRKCGIEDDAERNIQLPEEAADTQVTRGDSVLAERLVHEVRVAAREIGPQDRALSKPELLNEQREADRHLPAPGPGGHMDRLAREPGDPVGSLLGNGGGRGSLNGGQERNPGDGSGRPNPLKH